VGKEVVRAGNASNSPPRWIGEANVPLELDNTYRQKLQREIEQINRDPVHMQVKGVFMFLYSPPHERCDGVFSPGTSNVSGAGGS
jgi:hypothetical protein